MLELWVIYALIAFAGYFCVNFLLKLVSTQNRFMVAMILYATAAVTMLILLAVKGDFAIDMKHAGLAAAMGLFSVIGLVFSLKSVELAPNPGYAAAIFSSNFVLLALVSIWAFGSELTLQKAVGVLATFVGLVLLSL